MGHREPFSGDNHTPAGLDMDEFNQEGLSDVQRIHRLEAVSHHLLDKLDSIQKLIMELQQEEDEEVQDREAARWTCDACKRLIGFLNFETLTVRLKDRNTLTFIEFGEGSAVVRSCPGCAEMNRLEWGVVSQMKQRHDAAKKATLNPKR